MKNVHLITTLSLLLSLSAYSQSKSILKFDKDKNSFFGFKYEQAEYLLRSVKPMGIINKENAKIPSFLSKIWTDSIISLSKKELINYIKLNGFSNNEIGGNINDSISKNENNINAKYFVIHDTSSPNYKFEDFPSYINNDNWQYNDVEKEI